MEAANQMGNLLLKLDMFPYFDLAHYCLACLMIRDDDRLLDGSSKPLSRKHPFASWLSSMMMCFAGAIIGNFLVGDSLIAPFKDNTVLIATAVWYIVNYSPFDISYWLMSILPGKAALFCLKEVHRMHKIRQAIHASLVTYPHHAYFIIVVLGTIKGAAGNYLRFVQRPMIGVWTPAGNDVLKPSFVTKASCLASIIFLLEATGHLPAALPGVIFIAVVSFVLYFRLWSLVAPAGWNTDPFAPVENVVCYVLLGGLWDSLGGATGSSDTSHASAKKNQ